MRTDRRGTSPEPADDAPVVNPFVTTDVAARYARARPDLHTAALAEVRPLIGEPNIALDVGCGTGLSTRALAEISGWTVGIDASPEMLAEARDVSQIAYVIGSAEAMPFRVAAFDLVTVASAIHWFDMAAIDEIGRVLGGSSWLVIYDIWFRGEMLGESAFGEWMRTRSSRRYPRVAKRSHPEDAFEGIGLTKVAHRDLHLRVSMHLDELVEYLMTHSERIAAVRDRRETEEEQRTFLKDGLQPFFHERVRDLSFGADIEVFSRNQS